MKRVKTPHRAFGPIALLLCLALILVRNRYAFKEGLIYLGQMVAWRPTDVTAIDADGSFGVLHDLVSGTNQERYDLVKQGLIALGLSPLDIPSCEDCPPNLLIKFGGPDPCRLILAHYDKSRETTTYQGASDNSAAVAVLMALASELASDPPARPVALLFTSGEEKGLWGAHTFLQWANESGFGISSVIGIDMIGREELAVRPLAPSGLHFWLPVAGNRVFDGHGIRQAYPYRQPNPELVEQLRRASHDNLIVYRAVSGYSDALPFEGQGIPTALVTGSDIYYANLVWEQDTDRIELLDERSLHRALNTLIAYAHAP